MRIALRQSAECLFVNKAVVNGKYFATEMRSCTAHQLTNSSESVQWVTYFWLANICRWSMQCSSSVSICNTPFFKCHDSLVLFEAQTYQQGRRNMARCNTMKGRHMPENTTPAIFLWLWCGARAQVDWQPCASLGEQHTVNVLSSRE